MTLVDACRIFLAILSLYLIDDITSHRRAVRHFQATKGKEWEVSYGKRKIILQVTFLWCALLLGFFM